MGGARSTRMSRGPNLLRGYPATDAAAGIASGHCADARCQAALVPCRFVAVDDFLGDQAVDDGYRLAVARLRRGLVALLDGCGDLTHGAAHARAQSDVSRAMFFRLASSLFRCFRVGHEISEGQLSP